MHATHVAHRAVSALGHLPVFIFSSSSLKPLDRLVGPFLHPRRDHAVAVHHRLEDLVRHEPGLVADGFERGRLQRDVTGHAFVLEGPADALWRHNIVVDAAKRVLATVGRDMDDTPRAARPRVELVDLDLVPARAPPLHEQLRVGVGLEHELARRVEHDCRPDLLLARLDHVFGLRHVGQLLLSSSIFLLLDQILQHVVQALEALVPEAPVFPHPVRGLLEPAGLQPARPPLRVAALRDQAGALQHFEMFGDAGEAQVERLGQLRDRSLALCKTCQDRPPGGIGEGCKRDAQMIVRHRISPIS